MTNDTEFLNLITAAFGKEIIKKLVFSQPKKSEIKKVSGRVCLHNRKRILALEYSLPGNTVSQRNVNEEELEAALTQLISEYKQINLLTTVSDAERRITKSENTVYLGADTLKRRLDDERPSFERAIEELDKRKNYILSGSEPFLITLGISDKTGRVHDKKQGKFRQINRFLEHIKDVYDNLPKSDPIRIYDLCSGKSYLSFAAYYYLTAIKRRKVDMLAIDLKRDVIRWCENVAAELSYTGMRFICDNVTNTPKDTPPDMVISLHACDVATDIVIEAAISLGAKIILSTPCCHRYLIDKIDNPALAFVTDYPKLCEKLSETLTDAMRLCHIKAAGYRVSALELTDPENTPKNTLIRAIREEGISEDELAARKEEEKRIRSYVLGANYSSYLKDILKSK